MFLKRVVLEGFKSFANRTEFDFGPGITGIVGPNGCGKSNILDAVRWVLGEQSARSLRGGRMLDVVFAGSASRPAGNAAEVTLTFDNATRFLPCETPEVSLTRTLYRSGESEYRLNGETCRLKDIRLLLLDTGIGVDAYSIIEQGRVDSLLQAGPLERRTIFEEAAGISKYRAQRTEAERKLERSEQNLLRLNDVLVELERRLRSVKLAAGKARNYQEYDARLRELRSAFSLAEYHQMAQSRAELEAVVGARRAALGAHRGQLGAREAELAALESELHAADEALEAAEARLAELHSQRSTLAERHAQLERRLAELAETRTRRAAQAVETAARVAATRTRLSAAETELAALAAEAARQQAAVEELRTARAAADERCAAARAALETARTAAFDAARQAALLRNEHTHLTQQQQRIASELGELLRRDRLLRQTHVELEQRRRALADEATTLDRRASELATQVRALDDRAAALEADARALDARLGELKEARAGVLSRRHVLTDMDRRLEGVDQGTQAVIGWQTADPPTSAVVGLVADLLRIDDPRVAALEPVLATFENRVVVRSATGFVAEFDARGGCPGPVQVVALDRLSQRAAERPLVGQPGVVAYAADWVTCGAEHRALAESCLGRVVLTETRADALRLAEHATEGYTFVSLDGCVATATGQFALGPALLTEQWHTPGLISRKAEIRRLQQQLDEVETQLEQATRARQTLAETQSDVQVQRGALVDQLAAVQREYATRQTALMRLDDEVARHQREQAAVTGELSQRHANASELERRAAQVAADQATADAAQQENETRVQALAADLTEHEGARHAAAQSLTQGMVDLGRANERRAAAEAGLHELTQRGAALEREQAAAEAEAAAAVQASAQAETELSATQTAEIECAGQVEQAQSVVGERRQQRAAQQERLAAGRQAQRALLAEIEQVEAALHERQVALREVEVRAESLVTRVREELGLELAERYAGYQAESQDWEAVRAEIEELRGKIARLGHVNLDALQELDELTPRYEHLAAQRGDLEASIAKLRELIAALDEESRTRFASSFETIRGHFQELFRKLFGGGRADIVLEDPTRPLECGIDVIARPPGKEPQSLSLLSGGEKTLAAVALLLAVFQSRPAPFAILDEVDAALDETNVGRFNTVIAEFTAQSQFVVITHNKRTMQQADVLYGVTMAESGVSQRVAVRFDERVETPHVA